MNHTASPFYQIGEQLLDCYRIESKPYCGGMGNVWRVKHMKWNVDLAFCEWRKTFIVGR